MPIIRLTVHHGSNLSVLVSDPLDAPTTIAVTSAFVVFLSLLSSLYHPFASESESLVISQQTSDNLHSVGLE